MVIFRPAKTACEKRGFNGRFIIIRKMLNKLVDGTARKFIGEAERIRAVHYLDRSANESGRLESASLCRTFGIP